MMIIETQDIGNHVYLFGFVQKYDSKIIGTWANFSHTGKFFGCYNNKEMQSYSVRLYFDKGELYKKGRFGSSFPDEILLENADNFLC